MKETKDLYDKLMVLTRSSRDIDQRDAISNYEFLLHQELFLTQTGKF